MKNKFEYKNIPLNLIKKASWNYKTDDPEVMEKLKTALKKRGQIVNLIVAPIEDGMYLCCNGNHRVDAMKAIGMTEAMCCDVGAITQAQAELIAIETNELSFENDEVRLSGLLKHISEDISIEEMIETTPFDITSVTSHIRNLDFETSEDNKDEEKPEDIKEKEIDEDNIDVDKECPSCGYKWKA